MNDNKTYSRWTIEDAIELIKMKIVRLELFYRSNQGINKEEFKDLRDFNCCLIEWLKELKEIRENRS